jgi:hypothetical protein
VSRRPARFTEAEAVALLEEAQSRMPPMTIALRDVGLEIVPLESPPHTYTPRPVHIPQPRAKGTVYFVQYWDAVKIGWTSNLPQRLLHLQAGLPEKLTLAFSMPGDILLERSLHTRFSSDRLHGEWFRFSRAILEWIEARRG